MCAELLREIEEEVTNLLSDLIRINTTNPPGNETEAAQYLANNLKKEGFKCELFESSPGRGNIITRLKSTGEKPSLLLLSHLDVVAADSREWSVDPFGGLVEDGFIWGRGALDMKGMTVIELMALKLLKRNCVDLKGDVIFAATADEEKGGALGVNYLIDNYPKKIIADYVLNEGGGLAIPINNKNVYTIQTAEKGILWFKIKAKGVSGHGSIPDAADNAIIRMTNVIKKLGNYPSKILLGQTMKKFLSEIAREDTNLRQCVSRLITNPEMADQILEVLARKDKYLAKELRVRLKMTITPTLINGGIKENIIPSECEAVFDCRILPGQTPEETKNSIKKWLEDVGLEKLEFEPIQAYEPSKSPLGTPFYKIIVDTLKEFEPNCGVAPLMSTGGTDSRFLRKLGSVCYGFHPIRPDVPYGEMQKTIHGIDERISVKNLVFGTSVLYDVVRKEIS